MLLVLAFYIVMIGKPGKIVLKFKEYIFDTRNWGGVGFELVSYYNLDAQKLTIWMTWINTQVFK